MSDLPHAVSAGQSKLEEDLEHKKRDSDADGLCRSFSLAAEEKTLQAPLEKGTAEGELSPSVSWRRARATIQTELCCCASSRVMSRSKFPSPRGST